MASICTLMKTWPTSTFYGICARGSEEMTGAYTLYLPTAIFPPYQGPSKGVTTLVTNCFLTQLSHELLKCPSVYMINIADSMYTPTEKELLDNWFTPVAPDRWTNKIFYWHGPSMEYGPCWTLGDWWKNIYPADLSDVLYFTSIFYP